MIDNDLLTYFTPLFVMILVMSCCIRFAIRGCGGSRHSLEDYHSQYFVGSTQHYTSRRLYLDENNRVRSVMIAARVQPGDDDCPQIMGYVLDPSLLTSTPLSPIPPRYEDALKPIASPPKYEDTSGDSSSVFSISPAQSRATTARVESIIDETSDVYPQHFSLPSSITSRRHSDPWIPHERDYPIDHIKSAR